ncbi:hypothetical protein [Bosea lathyri]|uniref:Uncharacterized protein n=1 Tax=Bosea lathyri TaxID=1036778 RepID=A0A1H6BVF8_9HYPH|nr:hypothetical protein [Bosea lathyri]SEG64659.1 hypothetical protein SAMN04488115_108114 [Bosea lathyri]
MSNREKILRAMRAAGATGDKQTFTRLYVSNRISLAAANAEWRAGVAFARFVERRDAEGAKS